MQRGALLSSASEATACAAGWACVTITYHGADGDLHEPLAVQVGGGRGVPCPAPCMSALQRLS